MRSKWVVLGLLIMVSIVDRLLTRFLEEVSGQFSISEWIKDIHFVNVTTVVSVLCHVLPVLLGGMLADRIGARKVLTSALVLAAVIVGIGGLAETQQLIVIDRMAFFVCEAVGAAAAYKLLGEFFRPPERSLGMAAWIFVPSVLSLVDWRALSWATHIIGLHVMDTCVFAIGLLTAGLVYALIPDLLEPFGSVDRGQAETSKSIIDLFGALRHRHVWLLGGAFMMIEGGVFASSTGYQFDAENRLGISRDIVAKIDFLHLGAGVLGVFVMAGISAKLISNNRAVLVGACCSGAAGLMLLAATTHTAAVAVTAAMLGYLLLKGAYVPFWVIVLDTAPSRRFGTVVGLVLVFGSLGNVVAIASEIGLSSVTRSSSLLIILGIVGMIFAAVLMVFAQNQLGDPKGDLVPIDPLEA